MLIEEQRQKWLNKRQQVFFKPYVESNELFIIFPLIEITQRIADFPQQLPEKKQDIQKFYTASIVTDLRQWWVKTLQFLISDTFFKSKQQSKDSSTFVSKFSSHRVNSIEQRLSYYFYKNVTANTIYIMRKITSASRKKKKAVLKFLNQEGTKILQDLLLKFPEDINIEKNKCNMEHLNKIDLLKGVKYDMYDFFNVRFEQNKYNDNYIPYLMQLVNSSITLTYPSLQGSREKRKQDKKLQKLVSYKQFYCEVMETIFKSAGCRYFQILLLCRLKYFDWGHQLVKNNNSNTQLFLGKLVHQDQQQNHTPITISQFNRNLFQNGQLKNILSPKVTEEDKKFLQIFCQIEKRVFLKKDFQELIEPLLKAQDNDRRQLDPKKIIQGLISKLNQQEAQKNRQNLQTIIKDILFESLQIKIQKNLQNKNQYLLEKLVFVFFYKKQINKLTGEEEVKKAIQSFLKNADHEIREYVEKKFRSNKNSQNKWQIINNQPNHHYNSKSQNTIWFQTDSKIKPFAQVFKRQQIKKEQVSLKDASLSKFLISIIKDLTQIFRRSKDQIILNSVAYKSKRKLKADKSKNQKYIFLQENQRIALAQAIQYHKKQIKQFQKQITDQNYEIVSTLIDRDYQGYYISLLKKSVQQFAIDNSRNYDQFLFIYLNKIIKTLIQIPKTARIIYQQTQFKNSKNQPSRNYAQQLTEINLISFKFNDLFRSSFTSKEENCANLVYFIKQIDTSFPQFIKILGYNQRKNSNSMHSMTILFLNNILTKLRVSINTQESQDERRSYIINLIIKRLTKPFLGIVSTANRLLFESDYRLRSYKNHNKQAKKGITYKKIPQKRTNLVKKVLPFFCNSSDCNNFQQNYSFYFYGYRKIEEDDNFWVKQNFQQAQINKVNNRIAQIEKYLNICNQCVNKQISNSSKLTQKQQRLLTLFILLKKGKNIQNINTVKSILTQGNYKLFKNLDKFRLDNKQLLQPFEKNQGISNQAMINKIKECRKFKQKIIKDLPRKGYLVQKNSKRPQFKRFILKTYDQIFGNQIHSKVYLFELINDPNPQTRAKKIFQIDYDSQAMFKFQELIRITQKKLSDYYLFYQTENIKVDKQQQACVSQINKQTIKKYANYKLNYLILQNRKLSSLHFEQGEKSKGKISQHVSEVIIKNNLIKKVNIYKQITGQPRLQKLDLSKNNIENQKDLNSFKIDSFSNLQELNLSQNKLQSVGNYFIQKEKSINLKKLFLNQTNLKQFQCQIGSLQHLQLKQCQNLQWVKISVKCKYLKFFDLENSQKLQTIIFPQPELIIPSDRQQYLYKQQKENSNHARQFYQSINTVNINSRNNLDINQFQLSMRFQFALSLLNNCYATNLTNLFIKGKHIDKNAYIGGVTKQFLIGYLT